MIENLNEVLDGAGYKRLPRREDICPCRDDAQPHIIRGGACILCQRREDTRTYSIVRYYAELDACVRNTGLTLEQAQDHCNDPDSRSYEPGQWFDGYTEE